MKIKIFIILFLTAITPVQVSASVVAAVKFNGKVYMAADSQGNQGDKPIDIGNTKTIKQQGILLGMVGNLTLLNDLSNSPELRLPQLNEGEDIIPYLYNNIIVKMENFMLQKEIISPYGMSIKIIAAYKGRIFEISIDRLFILTSKFAFLHRIMEIHDSYYAIGSGANYTLGSLYTTSMNDMPPKLRLECAIKAAMKHCSTVGGRIFFIQE